MHCQHECTVKFPSGGLQLDVPKWDKSIGPEPIQQGHQHAQRLELHGLPNVNGLHVVRTGQNRQAVQMVGRDLDMACHLQICSPKYNGQAEESGLLQEVKTYSSNNTHFRNLEASLAGNSWPSH